MKWEIQGQVHELRGQWLGVVHIELRGGTWCLWHKQTDHHGLPLVSRDAISARSEALLAVETSLVMMASELKKMKKEEET